jgi:hypothetical protein
MIFDRDEHYPGIWCVVGGRLHQCTDMEGGSWLYINNFAE